jgi:DNA invertase Pin-like site-specific DNA recombinase
MHSDQPNVARKHTPNVTQSDTPNVTPHPKECAALYLRRSKKSAVNDYRNRSIAEQEGEGRAWAADERLTVVKVFTEEEGTGASRHSRKKRPEWDTALAELREGSEFRTLIVLEVSRADRRGAAQIAALLDEHRVTGRRLYIVDDGLDSASENDRRRIIDKAESAREESERLSKRIQRTKRYRRADGYFMGGHAPFGLKQAVPEGETSAVALAVDSETWPDARRLAEMALQGMTGPKIAAELNRLGIKPPGRAEVWRDPTVYHLLKSPSWAGLQTEDSRRDDSEGGGWRRSWDAMLNEDGSNVLLKAVGPDGLDAEPGSARVITPDERTMILAMLAARSAVTTYMRAKQSDGLARRGKRTSTTVLAGTDGLLRCHTCKGRTEATGAVGKTFYRCAAIGECVGFTAPMMKIDTYVIGQFMAMLQFSPDDSPLVRLVAARLGVRQNPGAANERAEATKVISHARAEVERIEDLLIDGRIGDAVADRRRAAALNTIAVAEARLASIIEHVPTGADLRRHLASWDTLALDDQRALLAMAVDRIYAVKVGQGRKTTPGDRLVIEWNEAATLAAVEAFRDVTTRTE